jgi:CRP-like cAMP-binding protein
MSDNSNLLLASLSPSDAAALHPHLKPIHLDHEQILFEAGDQIESVYFPAGSIVSIVVGLSTGEMVEAAMVGKDGLVGASSALDGKMSLSRAIVQIAGAALTCDVDALKSAALQSHTLLSTLIRHEQTLFSQAQQSAACLASHHTEARFARWMLRARDLTGSDDLNFTQEFVAEMLGVRRTSVTVVAQTLQRAGMIKYARGKIHILNIEDLNDTACECYATVKAQYGSLLGAGGN